jgi:hypothetical protein
MKKLNFLSLIIVSAVFMLTSCEKFEKEDLAQKDVFDVVSLLQKNTARNQETIGDVQIVSNYTKNFKGDYKGDFYLRGMFKDNSVGNLFVGNVEIPYLEGSYFKQYLIKDSIELIRDETELFGNTVKVCNAAFGTQFSTSHYIPELLNPSIQGVSDGYLDTDKNGLTVSWNPDTKNSEGIVAALILVLNKKTGETSKPIYKTVKETEKQIVFSVDELKTLTKGTEVSIQIGRGNYSVCPFENSFIGITSMSICTFVRVIVI